MMNASIAVVLFALVATVSCSNADPKQWVLLVAGSNTWGNYRHQADVCHAYQVVHAHGIPDENIVVMMYDDIANNRQNPYKGSIYNHYNGTDVYPGVLKDYTGNDVTPENFISILTGDKDAMQGIGSGKVIDSGPNDNVFVNFVDHGAVGLLGFPTSTLTVKQLNNAIQKMYTEQRYGKLVFYVEACEAGSMFNNVLPNNISVFATTATNEKRSSFACYCHDPTINTCLGDFYSVNWMEDSDKENLETETLETQYDIDKNETRASPVSQYGDLSISNLVVGEFQGRQTAPSKKVPKAPRESGVPSFEVPVFMLYQQLAKVKTRKQKEAVQKELDELIEKRSYVESTFKKIVSRVAGSLEQHQRLVDQKPDKLTQLDCHDQLVHTFNHHCFNLGQHTYAMKFAYILANICEERFDANNVARSIIDVCKSVSVSGTVV